MIVNHNFGSVGDDYVQCSKSGRQVVRNKSPRRTQKGSRHRICFPQMLANYLHMVLKGKIRDNKGRVTANLSTNQIDEHCERALLLFPFMNDKDIFRDCFKVLMMKRLLGDGYNAGNEAHILSLLKHYQGVNYVYKLETMHSDLQTSRSIESKFLAEWHTKQFSCKPDVLRVRVLSRSAWPSTLKSINILKLPDVMERCQSIFWKWYTDRHRNRELSQHWLESSAVITAKFPNLNPHVMPARP